MSKIKERLSCFSKYGITGYGCHPLAPKCEDLPSCKVATVDKGKHSCETRGRCMLGDEECCYRCVAVNGFCSVGMYRQLKKEAEN